MPTISLALSEVIKRRLFRAREHLQIIAPTLDPLTAQNIAQGTYQFNRGMKLPAVKHDDGMVALIYAGDANSNLATVIDIDLTQVELAHHEQEEAVIAAQELMAAVQSIALPLR